MKKFILFFTLTMFCVPSVFALDKSTVMNLKTDEAYIINLDSRPQNLQNSNPRIVKAEPVADISEKDSTLIIRTYEEGIAYITFKLKDGEKTIKLLIDNQADEDKGLLKLDKFDESKD